jgi:Glycolipid transfer protein (GLTP)
MFPNSGLDFTAQALRKNTTNSTEELSVSFRDAYGDTLKPHHNFMVKPIFSAAMSATPYRKDFYGKLGEDQEQVKAKMEVWLSALEKRVVILKDFQSRPDVKI